MGTNKNKKVNVQYLQDLADSYKKSKSSSATVDIVTFAQAQWGLNMTLFPVQKFILKTYYGMQLDDTLQNIIIPDQMNTRQIGRFTQKGFMNFLIETGRTNLKQYIPGNPRRQLVLSNGRRSSKSSIASVIANYEVYKLQKMGNPQAYFGQPNGQQIAVCTTSVSQDTASTLFSIMKSYCLNCSFLREKVVNRASQFFSLITQNDIANGADPSLFLICGGAKSSSIRGHNNIVVIIDQAAFFPTSGAGNGDELYQALTPSIGSFTIPNAQGKRIGQGKIILISSPYGKSGLFYKKYMESFQYIDSMLMYNMYSAMVNPTIDSSLLRDEKKRNPSLFDCQYGAKFSDTLSSWMDLQTLTKIINNNLPVNPKSGKNGIQYYMGIDYAGKNDGAAISIVHKDGNKVILDYCDVYYGSESDVWIDEKRSIYADCNKLFMGYQVIPLQGFADQILRLNQLFPIKYGWFDQFNGYGLMEMLKSRGLYQFQMKPINSGLNTQMYQYAKQMICSGFIEIPNHESLIKQIISLQENKNGSKVKVQAPKKRGSHDDMTDSFVQAIYGISQYSKSGKINAKSIGYSANNYVASNGKGYNSYYNQKYKMHGMNDKRGLY